MADGSQHRSSVGDEAGEAFLHGIEGCGGFAQFGGAADRQWIDALPPADPLGRIGQCLGGTQDVPCEQTDDQQNRQDADKQRDRQRAPPLIARCGTQVCHQPASVGQRQGRIEDGVRAAGER